VKPYYSEEEPVPEVLEENHDQPALEGESDSDIIVVDTPQPRRGRGRPKGSRNRRHSADFEEQFIAAIEGEVELSMAFMTAKEKADFDLAKQLRKEGRITTPGAPF
jgi:hypothetical protein